MKALKNGEYEYREKDFLGEGSFAKVYKGIIVKTKRVIAVRLLSLKLIKQFGHKIKSIISNLILYIRPRSFRLEGTIRNSRSRLPLHDQDLRLFPHLAQRGDDPLILSRRQSLGRGDQARSNPLGWGTLNSIPVGSGVAIYSEEEGGAPGYKAGQCV